MVGAAVLLLWVRSGTPAVDDEACCCALPDCRDSGGDGLDVGKAGRNRHHGSVISRQPEPVLPCACRLNYECACHMMLLPPAAPLQPPLRPPIANTTYPTLAAIHWTNHPYYRVVPPRPKVVSMALSTPSTTGVLLAAGAGTRLGRGPKALLPFRAAPSWRSWPTCCSTAAAGRLWWCSARAPGRPRADRPGPAHRGGEPGVGRRNGQFLPGGAWTARAREPCAGGARGPAGADGRKPSPGCCGRTGRAG